MKQHEVMELAIKSPFKNGAKIVLMTLCYKLDWNTWSRPMAVDYMQEFIFNGSVSRNTITRAFKELEKAGVITRETVQGGSLKVVYLQVEALRSLVESQPNMGQPNMGQPKMGQPNMGQGSTQNGSSHGPKWVNPRPNLGHNIINNNLSNNLNNNLERPRDPELQPQAAPQPQQHNQSQPLRVYVPTMEERERVLRESLAQSNAEYEARLAHLSPERRRHEEIMMRAQNLKAETYK